ncbi:MAG TPA: hypothetical protein VGM37_02845, partial [Armatimonadota bacterium]
MQTGILRARSRGSSPLPLGPFLAVFLTVLISIVPAWAQVSSFGENEHGQIGDGTTVDRLTPVTVNGLTNVIAVSAGEDHSLALRSDGTVWAWGRGAYGELGVNSETD